MTRLTATAVSALCWLAVGQQARAADAPPYRAADTARLTQLACEAGQAYARRDLRSLDALTADDYVQTDVRGGVLQRAEWLEFVRNRESELAIACDATEIRYYGDVAVVTGAWTYTRKAAPADVVTHSRWTSVWTSSAAGWKRHAFQNTYVNPNADHCNPTEARS